MLTAEQIHEAVAVLQSMGYSVVKLVETSSISPEGSWYRGRRVTIGDEYTLPAPWHDMRKTNQERVRENNRTGKKTS